MSGLKLLRDPPSKPVPIQLPRATSYFTEPILPDGNINYAKALSQDREPCVDDAENAAVLLIEFTEKHPSLAVEWSDFLEADADRWFLDAELESFGVAALRLQLEERLELGSWNAEDFPNVAAFLTSNEAACRDLTRIAEKRNLFLPLKTAANIADASRSFDFCIYQERTGDLSRIKDACVFWSKVTMIAANLKGPMASRRTMCWKIIPLSRMEAVCWDSFASIGVALQRFKSHKGSYPINLRDVADLPPAKLEDTFNDPFGAGDFEYLVKDE